MNLLKGFFDALSSGNRALGKCKIPGCRCCGGTVFANAGTPDWALTCTKCGHTLGNHQW